MRDKYVVTSKGYGYLEQLQSHWEYSTSMSMKDARHMWILEQYCRDRTEPMLGLVLGPIFQDLVANDFLRKVGG